MNLIQIFDKEVQCSNLISKHSVSDIGTNDLVVLLRLTTVGGDKSETSWSE